jgi:hypothetical protein
MYKVMYNVIYNVMYNVYRRCNVKCKAVGESTPPSELLERPVPGSQEGVRDELLE